MCVGSSYALLSLHHQFTCLICRFITWFTIDGTNSTNHEAYWCSRYWYVFFFSFEIKSLFFNHQLPCIIKFRFFCVCVCVCNRILDMFSWHFWLMYYIMGYGPSLYYFHWLISVFFYYFKGRNFCQYFFFQVLYYRTLYC